MIINAENPSFAKGMQLLYNKPGIKTEPTFFFCIVSSFFLQFNLHVSLANW